MRVKSENKTKRVETKFRKLRLQKGLSQKNVAGLAGLSHSAYVKIESGETEKIFIEVGKNIAKALGVSFNELFDIDNTEYQEKVKLLENEIELLKESVFTLKDKIADKEKIIELMSKNHTTR